MSETSEKTGAALGTAIVNALLVLVGGMVLISFVLPRGGGPTYDDLAPGDPVRLSVPSLRIDAPVIPITLSADAVLDPPRDTDDVGWWQGSAQPGEDTGQTVITGHTVHTGGGSMDRIGELEQGQKVDIETSSGTMRYRVDRVKVFSKESIAASAVRLFGQSGGSGRLVLVSCADWNGSYYESNVVVFGTPLGAAPTRAAAGA